MIEIMKKLLKILFLSLSGRRVRALKDDYDICEQYFQEKFYTCVMLCDSADPVCFSECNRELIESLEKCPGQSVMAIEHLIQTSPACSNYYRL